MRRVQLASVPILLLFVVLAASAATGLAPTPHSVPASEPASIPQWILELETHGPDPVPTDDELIDAHAPVDAVGGGPTCVDDPLTEPHARVMLMDPSVGVPSESQINAVRNLAIASDNLLAAEAARFGHDIHIKVRCDDQGQIEVTVVPVAVDSPTADFFALVAELAAQGYALPNVHYWVYYDGRVPGIGGQASAPIGGSQPLLTHGANTGPDYSFTYGYLSPRIMLHELTHNMGGVSYLSPNTSGGAHCNDGRDIMCYSDGGWQSAYRGNVCSRQEYDCNQDDYFHPKPPRDNFLWDHWNIASTLNTFIDHRNACDWQRGTHTAAGETTTIPLIDDCAGRYFTLDNDPPYKVALQHLPPVGVCFMADGVDVACHEPGVRVSGEIPADADAARVWVEGSAGGWLWQPN